jgi:hypothetical protein
MKTLLWLDDARDPNTNDWLNFSPIERPFHVVWVKSYDEFVSFINENGLPDGICFDHDLADIKEIEGSNLVIASDWCQEKTGYDCAKWLVSYCLDHSLPLPKYNIQSANPIGKENIDKLLKQFSR